MNERAQEKQMPGSYLVVYVIALLVLANLVSWVLESFAGLSSGPGGSIIVFLMYVACYPIRTATNWGDHNLKNKTVLKWLIDAFLWASAYFTLFTLYTAAVRIFPK